MLFYQWMSVLRSRWMTGRANSSSKGSAAGYTKWVASDSWSTTSPWCLFTISFNFPVQHNNLYNFKTYLTRPEPLFKSLKFNCFQNSLKKLFLFNKLTPRTREIFGEGTWYMPKILMSLQWFFKIHLELKDSWCINQLNFNVWIKPKHTTNPLFHFRHNENCRLH